MLVYIKIYIYHRGLNHLIVRYKNIYNLFKSILIINFKKFYKQLYSILYYLLRLPYWDIIIEFF